ncbi:flagellar basal body-associated FliL family protein [Thioalkalivibrio sulfidiphilus]|uniref:flagellar basal body-associated FliL family protein n=1 Tax=Thioalkalivibrio sulfidiphilus TaxID=1033854 RepID=UPI003B3004F1
MILLKPWRFSLAALLLFALLSGPGHAQQVTSAYIAMDPPVVVNLANPTRAQYLQMVVELQVGSAEDAGIVQAHMPVIRDTLILFFGGRDPAEVRPVANREELRAEALSAIREALESRSSRPAVEGLYFTSFLIQ